MVVTLFAATAAVDESSGGFLWFDDFHVIPRLVALGLLTSDQSLAMEVFNAFREGPEDWTTYVNNEDHGSFLNQFPTFPHTMDQMTGRQMTFEVSQVGPAITNSTLVFTFSAAGTATVPITWDRFVFWGIRPEKPFQERLIFQTDVLPARSGKTKRASLASDPRQSWNYRYIMDNGEETQSLENLLFDFQSKFFAVPVWEHESRITSAVTIGDTVITVDATEFRDYRVGGLVVLYTDRNTFEPIEIASITATTITLAEATTAAYAVGASALPLFMYNARSEVDGFDYQNNLSVLDVRFDNTENAAGIADTTPFSSFNSKVLLDNGNASFGRQFESGFRQNIVRTAGAGLIFQDSLWGSNKPRRRLTIRAEGLQEVTELRGLLYALRGPVISFYVPSDTEDLTAVVDLSSSDANLDVTNVGYTTHVRSRQPLNVIRIVFVDGSTPVLRTIQSSTITSPTVERLVVDSNWPSNITVASILRIEYVHEVRIVGKSVPINHDESAIRARAIMEIEGAFE